jgi:hypothetical protein
MGRNMGRVGGKSLVTLAVACGAWGCGAPMEGEEGNGDFTVEELPIKNGSTDFSSLEWMRVRTAYVANGGVCSGTVLDPRTVLTARHCVTTTAAMVGPITSPASNVQVRIDGGVFRSAEQIVPMEASGSEKHDVALIFVSAANAITEADGDPIFTPMEPNSPANYLDDTILISGWGRLQNTAPTGSGILRQGAMILDDDFVSELQAGSGKRDGVILRTDPEDQRGMPGDSGGPYWGDARVEGTLPRGIIGVHSGDGDASGTEAGTRVRSIRSWARGAISDHHGFNAGEGLFLSFSSSSDLNGASRFSPDGNAASWTVTGGLLVQSLNVPRTTLIWEDHVVRDFDASVQIDSPDDDGAGIVFHFANPQYYYCEANAQDNALRLRSRINGTITTLASATWSGSFATRKTMTVTGRDTTYTCSFDGLTITAVHTRIPVGSVGLIQDFNAGVRFNDFDFVGG